MHCTVVMPAYNTALFIREAIKSVLLQTYRDFDLLVIDDSSDDSTVDVATSMFSGYDASILSLNRHLGAAGATRVGIENARGPVVTVVDSDDKITRDSLSYVLPYFEEDPKLGYVWTQFVCSNGRRGWTRTLPSRTSLFDALTKNGWWYASHQRFFRKRFYDKSPGLNDKFPDASDLQLAVVISSTGCRTLHLKKVTYWYRMGRAGSISSRRGQQRKCHYSVLRWAREGFGVNSGS